VSFVLAGSSFVVRLYLQRLRHGGSWSLFCCPTCGGHGRVLWLVPEPELRSSPSLLCYRCCLERSIGVAGWYISGTHRRARRAEQQIPVLRAKLSNPDLPPRWRRGCEARLALAEALVAKRIRQGGKADQKLVP
jgi:hypothetical protein